MKRTAFLLMGLLSTQLVSAQLFSDNFDSHNPITGLPGQVHKEELKMPLPPTTKRQVRHIQFTLRLLQPAEVRKMLSLHLANFTTQVFLP
jgi:hypothetical protein